jgi:hypothetical protein
VEMKGGTKAGFSTISLGRLQYIRWVTAGPTQKTNIALHRRSPYITLIPFRSHNLEQQFQQDQLGSEDGAFSAPKRVGEYIYIYTQ